MKPFAVWNGTCDYGIEHEAIDGAYDVVTFEDLGNGQTKLTFVGNETMEDAKQSGQLESWNKVLDKLPQFLRTWRRQNKKLKL